MAEDEWEELSVGIGEEWDFDKGPLIGTIIGCVNVPLPEKSQRPGPDGVMRTDALTWKFYTDDGEEVFLWDSYQLAEALKECGANDRVKIEFKGMREIDNGARRVKQYKVFKAAGKKK